MHPELLNRTPFAQSLLFLGGGNETSMFAVALVQATYRIGPDFELELLELQPEIEVAGKWNGEPGRSSCRLEPQVAYAKPSTDVVLLGHAVPEGGRPSTQVLVGVRLAGARKVAVVFGDRRLARGLVGMEISPAAPFERMPLTYERAFGGWDRRDADPARHTVERRNPVGVGFRDARLPACEETRLPNIEDPARLYKGYGDVPPPCGFGFLGPDWMPRAGYAGTYDQGWENTRKPHLPSDFDPRFFNAASSGLVMPTPLRGDEEVETVGLSASGPCRFKLPGVPPPRCAFAIRRREAAWHDTMLDTVVIDMDSRWVVMQWRGRQALPNGPHDLQALEIRAATA